MLVFLQSSLSTKICFKISKFLNCPPLTHILKNRHQDSSSPPLDRNTAKVDFVPLNSKLFKAYFFMREPNHTLKKRLSVSRNNFLIFPLFSPCFLWKTITQEHVIHHNIIISSFLTAKFNVPSEFDIQIGISSSLKNVSKTVTRIFLSPSFKLRWISFL